MFRKTDYLVWLLSVIIWNYGLSKVISIYDDGVAILWKHIFDLIRIIP